MSVIELIQIIIPIIQAAGEGLWAFVVCIWDLLPELFEIKSALSDLIVTKNEIIAIALGVPVILVSAAGVLIKIIKRL